MKPLVSLDPVAITAFSLNALLQMTALCLIALIAVRCVFRHNPSLRYVACLAGLVCLLLSPLATCLQNRAGYGLLTLSLPKNLFLSPASEARVPSTPVVSAGTNVGMREASVPQQ